MIYGILITVDMC